MKTYCYLFNGANTTYAGIISDKTEICIRFRGISVDDARKHIHFGEMITNKDDYSKEDKEPLEPVCKKHPKSLAWWYDSKQ